ncbi:MAG: prolyl oligopeptidase family serine peptidase, partial [Nannocystaceae bacterium]
MHRTTSARARFCLWLSLGIVGCAPPHAAKPYPQAIAPEQASRPIAGATTSTGGTGSVSYFGTEIDLQPYLAGFPYGNFDPDLRNGKMFFFEEGERYTLKMLDLEAAKDGPYDLAGAPAISDVDWSARSLWGIHLHAPSNTLWLHADARNDEVMNLWTLSLESGELRQVTQHDYIYGFGFSEDESTIAYLPRYGKKAPFEKTCLNVLDVKTQRVREVVCDSPKLKFTWATPRFSPDGNEVFFDAQVEGDRNRVQLVAVDLTKPNPKVRVLTNPKRSRNSPRALRGWLGDTMLFLANDDGYNNLYRYNRKTSKIAQLTRFKEDITSAQITNAGIFAVHRTPRGSTLVIVEPTTGKVLGELARPGTADVLDADKGRVLWSQRAPDIFTEINLAHLDPGAAGQAPGLQNHRVVSLPDELSKKIVQCRAEAVTIPTFDRDPATGKTRELHAFVLHPTQPRQNPEQRLALITAFYGGRNRYSSFDNIMCAAGLTIVSPAVRGSSGFGKQFYGLNDKDLGGDEIVDLHAVARWVEQEFALKPHQIGVYGG